jgi:hypothetical protein
MPSWRTSAHHKQPDRRGISQFSHAGVESPSQKLHPFRKTSASKTPIHDDPFKNPRPPVIESGPENPPLSPCAMATKDPPTSSICFPRSAHLGRAGGLSIRFEEPIALAPSTMMRPANYLSPGWQPVLTTSSGVPTPSGSLQSVSNPSSQAPPFRLKGHSSDDLVIGTSTYLPSGFPDS